jgi:hypothetical protein
MKGTRGRGDTETRSGAAALLESCPLLFTSTCNQAELAWIARVREFLKGGARAAAMGPRTYGEALMAGVALGLELELLKAAVRPILEEIVMRHAGVLTDDDWNAEYMLEMGSLTVGEIRNLALRLGKENL